MIAVRSYGCLIDDQSRAVRWRASHLAASVAFNLPRCRVPRPSSARPGSPPKPRPHPQKTLSRTQNATKSTISDDLQVTDLPNYSTCRSHFQRARDATIFPSVPASKTLHLQVVTFHGILAPGPFANRLYAALLRKNSSDRFNPSLSPTRGSHPSSVRALAMSGRRRVGSSTGRST